MITGFAILGVTGIICLSILVVLVVGEIRRRLSNRRVRRELDTVKDGTRGYYDSEHTHASYAQTSSR